MVQNNNETGMTRALSLDFTQNLRKAIDIPALGWHHMRQVPEGFSLSAVSPDI